MPCVYDYLPTLERDIKDKGGEAAESILPTQT